MLHLLIPLIFSGSLFLLFAVFSRVGVYVCNGAALSAFSLVHCSPFSRQRRRTQVLKKLKRRGVSRGTVEGVYMDSVIGDTMMKKATKNYVIQKQRAAVCLNTAVTQYRGS